MLLSMILMAVVTAPGEPGAPTPPWPWPSLEEARPDTGTQDRQQLLGWLVSPEKARRTEAQIRLLDAMDTLLPQLEALAARTPEEDARGRLREFLQMLTWQQVSLEQLAPHPTLSALARQGVEEGLRLVAPWETGETTEGIVEEARGGWCGVGPQPVSVLHLEGPPLQQPRDELERLRGLARPAIERLLSSASAPVRLRGMALANSMDLRPSAALLTSLVQDEAPVTLQGTSDGTFGPGPHTWRRYPLHVSLARLASDLGWKRPLAASPPPAKAFVVRLEERSTRWFTAAHALGDEPGRSFQNGAYRDLLNGLRSVGAWTARDEQDYWNRARPLWRAWWRSGAPWQGTAGERQRWLSLLSRHEGYQTNATQPRAGGPTVLTIVGPAGTEVELRYLQARRPVEKSAVRQGRLPLTLRGKPPGEEFDLRVKTGQDWTDLGLRFMATPEQRTTLWLEPTLRRAHLQRLAETMPTPP